MEKKNLLILGAGQYSAVAKDTALAMGCFDRIDFLDDRNPAAIGTLADLTRYADRYQVGFVAMGNPQLRLRYLKELENAGYELVTLVHPSAVIMPSATVAGGCIVEAQCVVNSNTVVKTGCILSAGSVVNHDCVLHEACHVDCCAVVPSGRHVPTGTKVPCGTVF